MKLIKGLKTASRKKGAPLTASAATKTSASRHNGQSGHTGSSKTVTIEARIDVGFGNSLYLRGEGEGLNWNHGIPLTCVDGTTWKWSCEAKDNLKFKLLLNDAVWAQGEDLIAAPGQRLE